MDCLIAFGAANDHPLAGLLNKRHRHVWCALKTKNGWVSYDWHQGVPVITAMCAPEFDLEAHLKDEGWEVIATTVGHAPTVGTFTLNNCVGHVKSVCAIRSWAWTPHQLYQHLRQRSARVVDTFTKGPPIFAWLRIPGASGTAGSSAAAGMAAGLAAAVSGEGVAGMTAASKAAAVSTTHSLSAPPGLAPNKNTPPTPGHRGPGLFFPAPVILPPAPIEAEPEANIKSKAASVAGASSGAAKGAKGSAATRQRKATVGTNTTKTGALADVTTSKKTLG